jgi:putative MATE family efflux protein
VIGKTRRLPEVALLKASEIRQLGRPVYRLTLPVIIEQVSIAVMGVVNTILAARLGDETISAIGNIDAVSVLIISLFSALAIGGTVTVAQFTGRQDSEQANRTAAQALMSNLAISGLITAAAFLTQKPLVQALYGGADRAVIDLSVQYFSIILWSFVPIALINIAFGVLRGAGDTRTPMAVSIIMGLANVIFSWILIYGASFQLGTLAVRIPALGIKGAAIGLLSARTLGMLLSLIPLFWGSRLIRLNSLRFFKIRPDLLRCIFWLGIPASAENLLFQVGKLIVQTFAVRLGTTVIAAITISNSMTTVFMTPGVAMQIAAMTLVGQQIGSGRPLEAKRYLKFLLIIASVAIGLVSLIILPFLNSLIGFYTVEPATFDLTRKILLVYLVLSPFIWPASFITPAGLRAAGDVRYTLSVSLASVMLLRVFLAYVFTVWLPLGGQGIWYSMYCDWIGRSAFFLGRLRGDRWHAHDLISRVKKEENEKAGSG